MNNRKDAQQVLVDVAGGGVRVHQCRVQDGVPFLQPVRPVEKALRPVIRNIQTAHIENAQCASAPSRGRLALLQPVRTVEEPLRPAIHTKTLWQISASNARLASAAAVTISGSG